MDNKNFTGVKVTYIETQFVTSDEAGFKDLVQRLTGRSTPMPPPPPAQRPLLCPRGTTSRTAAGAAVPQGYHYPVTEVRPAVVNNSRTPTSYMENMGLHEFIDIGDFDDLFYAGANERSDGCYVSFPY